MKEKKTETERESGNEKRKSKGNTDYSAEKGALKYRHEKLCMDINYDRKSLDFIGRAYTGHTQTIYLLPPIRPKVPVIRTTRANAIRIIFAILPFARFLHIFRLVNIPGIPRTVDFMSK